jgi:hypothetical protein
MIHELRQYTLKPGKLPEYLEHARTIGRPARGNDFGVNHGYWTTEHGPLNQVWHLWSYDSLDERARLRGELQKNKAWTTEYVPRIRPLLERQDVRFIHPMKPITPPKAEGGIYELRIYRTTVGDARRWAEAFLKIMPVREKYSPNVGIWVGEAPQPNEVLHMWNYANWEARKSARAALFQDADWLAYLKEVAGIVVEMQSTILIPTAYSSMK